VTDGPLHPAILASDAERERTVDVLRGAVVEGRLTLEEFSDRVGLAHAARTDQDLAKLGSDLPAGRPGGTLQNTVRHLALCSRLSRLGLWDLPPRSSYRCIFGTIDLDLRQARLAASETVIEIYNLFGTVTLLVPEGVRVDVQGGGAFASQEIQSPPTAPVPDAPVLRIRARGPGGTLHVRSREAPSRWAELIGGGNG
jgi:uncharacterized protein DUF1707/cell wall-active antibiotic response 4TMS protein YvqF